MANLLKNWQIIKETLHDRNALYLFLSWFISNIGDEIHDIALMIMVYKLTGSGLVVGIYMLFLALPTVILGPFAGVLVDRYDRKKIFIFMTIGQGIMAMSLIFVKSVPQIYCVAFLLSIFGVFTTPAALAIIPRSVKRENLMAFNSLASTLIPVSTIIGPIMGGIIVAGNGYKLGFILNALSFFVSALCFGLVKLNQPIEINKEVRKRTEKIMEALVNGFKYTLRNRVIFPIIVVFTILILGSSIAKPVFVVLLEKELLLSATFLGYLRSAYAVGGIVGGLVLPWICPPIAKNKLYTFALFLEAVAYFGFVTAHSIWIIVFMNGLIGLGLTFLNNVGQTIYQEIVPNELIGRVFTVSGSIHQLAGLACYPLGGFIVDKVNSRLVFMISGCIALITAFISFFTVSRVELKNEIQSGA